MNRYIKALGLSLVAVFAMSAVGASGAQAQTPVFTACETEGEKCNPVAATLDATSEENEDGVQKFSYGTLLGTVTLECSHFEGTASLPEDSSTVTTTEIKYSGTVEDTEADHCGSSSVLGNNTVDVSTNGCQYTFHVDETIEENVSTGTVDVTCDKGKEIEITVTEEPGVSQCTIKVPGNNTDANGYNQGLEHVIYRNQTNPSTGKTDVTIEATVEDGITMTTEGGLFNCGKSNGVHENAASYFGSVTVTATNDEGKPIDGTVVD
jgi:hypothetical protein